MAILRSSDECGFLGDAFRFEHGDLASRDITAEVKDDAIFEMAGSVDWDLVCFAPKFCAYRPPMDMWISPEHLIDEEDIKELFEIPKKIHSAACVRYVLSEEVRLGIKLWLTLREGMVGEHGRRGRANDIIWEWNRLFPDDKICQLHRIY